jgi:glycosyltransferase involved in cell wall biosynthesis
MSSKKRIIVSVTNDLYTDQRVHKVCQFLHENNYNVLLVGRKRRNSHELNPRDYKTKRMRLFFENGALFYAFFNVRLFFFLLFRKSDVLLSNDLDTLFANYLVAKIKGERLIYDTHELFTEVPELTSRPKVRAVWLRIERWIFPKLKTVYTVNQSIANIYEERYNVPVKVVRNISPKWIVPHVKTKLELKLPEDKHIIILQGAGINIDRGAEEAVEAMKSVENAVLIFVGDGDVIPQLKEKVDADGLGEKVRFFGKKPYQELMQYTFHADIGLTLDKDTNPNYKYSLPNKVFDYIHTNTAIIASNVLEVLGVVEKHDVGIILIDVSPEAISSAINTLIKDEKLLNQLKLNCSKAADQENWEKEVQVLKSIYLK